VNSTDFYTTMQVTASSFCNTLFVESAQLVCLQNTASHLLQLVLVADCLLVTQVIMLLVFLGRFKR